jgi:rhamnogalacturonan acetylesterase
MNKKHYLLLIITCAVVSLCVTKNSKPTLYIIGDSTVKNGSGKGADDMWGWGSLIHEAFDTARVHIENHAIGGRSSRTFMTEGRWDKILKTLKKGDYVLMQFGHNDGGAVNDSTRARGSIRGVGEETQEIDNILTKKHETVHSFGWYMRKYITDTKAAGATPIVCSLVPRNNWKDGKVQRSINSYTTWAQQTASQSNAFYMDLNDMIALKYEASNEANIKTQYFTPKDNTHTNKAGAKLNAETVVEGLKTLKKCKLRKMLL